MPRSVAYWEVDDALLKWIEFGGSEEQFKEFTGLPNASIPLGAMLTDETGRRVDMILGPHANTVVKAYLAKRK